MAAAVNAGINSAVNQDAQEADQEQEDANKPWWEKTLAKVILHLLLIAALLGIILFGTWLLRDVAQGYADQWRGYLIPQTYATLQFPPDTTITPSDQLRLSQLHHTVQDRERLHASIMEFYYKRFFMGIITMSITGALAAIMLVIISKRGWENTDSYLITVFFIASAATVFFSSLPGVFRQDQNITDNKALLLKFMALENEVQSYAMTNEALNYTFKVEDLGATVSQPQESPAPDAKAAETPPADGAVQQTPAIGIALSAKEFIHYVDLQLAQDNIAIGFDYQQVPTYQGVFETK